MKHCFIEFEELVLLSILDVALDIHWEEFDALVDIWRQLRLSLLS